jgi:hypothetical protein
VSELGDVNKSEHAYKWDIILRRDRHIQSAQASFCAKSLVAAACGARKGDIPVGGLSAPARRKRTVEVASLSHDLIVTADRETDHVDVGISAAM